MYSQERARFARNSCFFVDLISVNDGRWRERNRHGQEISFNIYELEKNWIQIYDRDKFNDVIEFFDSVDFHRMHRSCMWLNEDNYALFLLRFA